MENAEDRRGGGANAKSEGGFYSFIICLAERGSNPDLVGPDPP